MLLLPLMLFPLHGLTVEPAAGAQLQSAEIQKRFLVSYTIDFGYSLHQPDNLNEITFVSLKKEDVLEEFNQFFSNKNLERYVGKKVYCDCTGKYSTKNGVLIFRISKAYLFAE
jgi:hypothetical protein